MKVFVKTSLAATLLASTTALAIQQFNPRYVATISTAVVSTMLECYEKTHANLRYQLLIAGGIRLTFTLAKEFIMRSFFKSLIAVTLLSPAFAMASDQPSPVTFVVPGVMTTAGERFASQCSDEAFAVTINKEKQAVKCEKLLIRWHAEAAQRIARRANPRVEKVAVVSPIDSINLPFDTVAMLRSDPFAGF